MATWARIGLRAVAAVLFLVAAVVGLLSLFVVVERGSPARVLRFIIFLAAFLLGCGAWSLWVKARKPAPALRPKHPDEDR